MNWINVNDALPPENQTVLVFTDWACDNLVFMAYSDKKWCLSGSCVNGDYRSQEGVLYWSEITEPNLKTD